MSRSQSVVVTFLMTSPVLSIHLLYLQYGQQENIERNSLCKYHCGADAFGTGASTEVRLAGNEQLGLKTMP